MKKCTKCNAKYEMGSFCPACGGELVDDGTSPQIQQDTPELPPLYTNKPNKLLFVILVVVVLFLFGAVGFAFMKHAKDVNQEASAAVGETGQPVGTEVDVPDEPGETPEAVVEAEPVEEPEPEPVKEEKKKTSTYKYVKKDISWKDAKKEAKEAGGHLATITSEEEYKKVSKVASESGLTFLWLGARVEEDESWSDVQWITGEDWTFKKWYPGEPSYEDADGVDEFYLCFWNVKHDGENIGWTFNDQRNDIAGAFKEFRGKVGYIIEFEE